jgi:Coenzyme PQQ synthesis protein D (PqqD)
MTEGEVNETGASAAGHEPGQVRPSEDAVVKRLGDEVVLVQLKTNEIYTLNRTGARLWELLEAHHDLERAQEQMLEEFEVSEEQLRAEVRSIVDELVTKGLLDKDASS